MKVLVTGGAGFIGSHTVDKLLAAGHEVTIFDHLDRKREDALTFLGDVRDWTAVSEAVCNVDGVIHLAGVLGTAETINSPLPAVETNILGGLNVMQAVRNYGVPAVQITLGNYWMNNTYSISKNTAERFAQMYNKEHGTKIAVVRALNAYGPRQKFHPVKKLMPNIINQFLKGEQISVYGDGEQIMDHIYVSDVADVLVAALLHVQPAIDPLLDVYGGSYVLEAGSGNPTSVNQIVEAVHLVMAMPGVWQDWVEYQPMRAGEPPNAVVLGDPDTLAPLGISRADLVPFLDGIAATVEYYEELRA